MPATGTSERLRRTPSRREATTIFPVRRENILPRKTVAIRREAAAMFATTPALAPQNGALLITTAKHSRPRLDCGQISYQAGGRSGRTDDGSLKKGRERGGRKESFPSCAEVGWHFSPSKSSRRRRKRKYETATTVVAAATAQLDRERQIPA